VDAPEPTNAQTSFAYKFFTKNERSEYTGGTGVEIARPADVSAPRWIEISFKKPEAEYNAKTLQEVTSYLDGKTLIELAQGGYIHIEDSVTSERFQREQITASGLDLRTVAILSGSAESLATGVERGFAGGESSRSISELASRISESLTGVRGDVPAELVLSASSAENDAQVGQTIIKYLNASGQSAQRVNYQSRESKQQIERKADVVTDRQETLGINRLVLDSVVQSSICNMNHMLHDEINSMRSTSADIQSAARSQSASAGISPSSYDISVLPFYTNSRTPTSYRSVLVGHIIEKLEIKGSLVSEHPSILLVGSDAQNYKDGKINYGSTYKYRVRSIFMREVPATFATSGRRGVARFLVSSSGESAESIVSCVEIIPPPEVADFMVSYDYDSLGNRISWSLPVNPQRDIKYFQIFRRFNVNQPFSLIRVIDFDDSTERETLRETYPNSVVEKVEIVKCLYVDIKVPQETEAIYAVCSVDAHGLTSGYSLQMACTFRRAKNLLETRLVSRPGAPKTYPNLYVSEEAFVDVLRSSDRRTLLTFFDPEALRIRSSNGAPEKFVEESSFTISIINEDLSLSDKIVLNSVKLTTLETASSSEASRFDADTAVEEAYGNRRSSSPTSFNISRGDDSSSSMRMSRRGGR
jgi:hypothetical protein